MNNLAPGRNLYSVVNLEIEDDENSTEFYKITAIDKFGKSNIFKIYNKIHYIYLCLCFKPFDGKNAILEKQKRLLSIMECCLLNKNFTIENIGLSMYALNVNPITTILQTPKCDFLYKHCLLHRISVLENDSTNNTYASYYKVKEIYKWLKMNANSMTDLYTIFPIFSLEVNLLYDKISLLSASSECFPKLETELKYDDLFEIHKLYDEIYHASPLEWNIITSKGLIIPYNQYKQFKMKIPQIDIDSHTNEESVANSQITSKGPSIKYMPLVSIDIETVSTNMESIPSGALPYEKINSITVIIELLRYNNSDSLPDRVLIFSYLYMDDLPAYVTEEFTIRIANRLTEEGFSFCLLYTSRCV